MLKFLIADDHPLYREALIAALNTDFEKVKYFESDCLNTTLSTLNKHRAMSLVLLDLNMPGCENFYGLLRVRQRFPDIPVAIISATETLSVVSQSMEFGATAYIPKTTPTSQIIEAVKAVIKGDTWLPAELKDRVAEVQGDILDIAEQVRRLTPKQFRVLRLLRKGLMNKQIASQLNVTEATVKAHISSIFKQFNVRSRTQILVKIEKLQLE
ncbi:LuxR C-terminal-related transcriptional regulator [Glaciecola siphonariae]|uniref:LuxR C-terminal-related transcriptional regulator n=1 Tax=Glaciecola siphonariae TaxID=521012 RepID=A0ABV9LS39_9ALTE